MNDISLSSDEKSWAMAAHAISFLDGGIILPLILYLAKKDQSQFVAFHALQSVYFGLLLLVIVACTCGLGVILVIPYLIYEFQATIAASNGEWYLLPMVGKMAYERHHPENRG
jgi:hypothetical protein